MKIFKISGIIFGIIIFLILAIGSLDDSQESTSSENTKKESSDENKQENESNKEKIYKMSEKVTFDKSTVAVTKIEKSGGNDFDKPKNGMEYIIVNVSIKNASQDKITYNSYDFKVQNGKGQLTDPAFTTIDTDTSLESGELIANGSVEGTISFEVPKNDPKLILLFEPSFWSDKNIKFKLQ